MNNPFDGVAIVGAVNTQQAKSLEGATSASVSIDAALAALEEAGVDRNEVDGVAGETSDDVVYALGLGPVWESRTGLGIRAIVESALAIKAGLCNTVVMVAGRAGTYTEHASTAPWTRASSEFSSAVGMYTAVDFALLARRHMAVYGTRPEHFARAASLIRNNGHVNPEAVFYGKGPYSPEDVLASRMVADPFHLLDCCITSEGGCAIVLTSAERAKDLRRTPVQILGAGIDHMGRPHHNPPSWDLRSSEHGIPNGYVGRRAAQTAFRTAGMSPDDVDVCEFYDPFSFEIIRQVEAFGFCGDGEGGDYIMDGNLDYGGPHPVNTDGGLLSFSHAGGSVQGTQRVVRAVQQLQGVCPTQQVEGAEVGLASYGGAGVFFTDVLLLGRGAR
jgi:acetyl-CoA acetyltransferase